MDRDLPVPAGRAAVTVLLLLCLGEAIVVKKDGGVWLHHDVVLRLQFDDHPQPIRERRRLVLKSDAWRRRASLRHSR